VSRTEVCFEVTEQSILFNCDNSHPHDVHSRESTKSVDAECDFAQDMDIVTHRKEPTNAIFSIAHQIHKQRGQASDDPNAMLSP
jgi:hypothetical protein